MKINELDGQVLFVIDFSAIVNIVSQDVWDKLTEHIIKNKIKVFVSKEFYENYEVIIKSLNEEQKTIAKTAVNFLSQLDKNSLLITKSDITNSKEIITKLCTNPKVCFVYYCDSEFAENVVRTAIKPQCKAIIIDEDGQMNIYKPDEIIEASTNVLDESVINNKYFKVDFEAEEGAKVKTKDKEIITLGKFIARGGEGSVYECNYKKDYVIKIYHTGQLNELRLRKILLMEKKQVRYDGICWPEKVVYSMEGKPLGFLMKKVSGTNLSEVFDGSETLLEKFPTWKKQDLVRFSIKVLQKIQYLHLLGIIVGDLRFKNILIDSKGEPCFVDLDSCQVKDLPCPIGFPDFTAPELQGVELKKVPRTYSSESYSCSVVIFKILFCGIHPYDQRNGADTLEEEMIARTFPYPESSKGDFSKIPLMGGYDLMWKNTPHQMHRLFYDMFKNGSRYSVSEMILMLKAYDKFLERTKEKTPSLNEIALD